MCARQCGFANAVMARLVPAIHDFGSKLKKTRVACDTRGHDVGYSEFRFVKRALPRPVPMVSTAQ